MTSKLTLRRIQTRVALGEDRFFAQENRRKVQVLAVGSDRDRVIAESFDAIDAVPDLERPRFGTARKSIGNERLFLIRLGCSPATPGAVEQVITDKTILKDVSARLR